MRTLYLVQQTHWAYDDQWHYSEGAIPRKAFVSRADAESYRAVQERDSRNALIAEDPGDEAGYWVQNLETTFGEWWAISSLNNDERDAKLIEIGFRAYTSDLTNDEWNDAWWRDLWAFADTNEKYDAIWRLFDKVRFYEVVEVEAEL